MSDLVKRLLDPAFGTESTERNLMNRAADAIAVLQAEAAAAEAALVDEKRKRGEEKAKIMRQREALRGCQDSIRILTAERDGQMRRANSAEAEAAALRDANREIHRRAQKAEGLLERMARFLNTWEAAAKRRKDYWAKRYIAAAAGHVRSKTGVSGQLRDEFYGAIVQKNWDTEKERDALPAEVTRLRGALEPFGKALQGNYSHQSDELLISCGHGKDDLRWVIPLGDWRKARAANRGEGE